MNPPLRTEEDNVRLFEGLIEGVFDVIATDHAPHTEFEKRQQDFEAAPFGITGLETVLPSMFHYFINEKGKLWQLVDDNNVAWHAGVSKWLDRKNLN